MTIQELLKNGGVLFGSRALEVSNAESDYDVAIMEEDFYRLFGKEHTTLPIANYFRMQPIYSARYLPKVDTIDGKIDIIILSDNIDYQIIHDSIQTLKKIPEYILEEKYLRITLFEKILIHNGFIDLSLN